MPAGVTGGDVEALAAGWSWANALEPGPAAPQPGGNAGEAAAGQNFDHLRLRAIGPTSVLSARSNHWAWSIQQRPPTDFRRSVAV